eukprot:TRINITY_DN363_c0_g1_i4.p1 TRINITY_DN363_c0_g1~~TRINITY_DN363_c0_g1_i4.p1  ORF type:complete len:239 (-),score=49.87 TRINITY_DN363_c0_g1_i4:533-1249(-)
MKPHQRQFDFIVFKPEKQLGIKLVEFLCRSRSRPKWALAGKSPAKLNHIKSTVDASLGIELEVFDLQKEFSLELVTSQTVVVINCSDNLDYSRNLIQACLRTQTHYLDLNIDPVNISDCIANYDGQARESKIKILPGCGAIEVLSDLGIFFAQKEECPNKRLSSSEVFVINSSSKDGIKSLGRHIWNFSKSFPKPKGKKANEISQQTTPAFESKGLVPKSRREKRFQIFSETKRKEGE